MRSAREVVGVVLHPGRDSLDQPLGVAAGVLVEQEVRELVAQQPGVVGVRPGDWCGLILIACPARALNVLVSAGRPRSGAKVTAAACSVLSELNVVAFPLEVASTRIAYDGWMPRMVRVEADVVVDGGGQAVERRGAAWSTSTVIGPSRWAAIGHAEPRALLGRVEGVVVVRASSRRRPASGRRRLTKVSSSSLLTGCCMVSVIWRNSTTSGRNDGVVAGHRGGDERGSTCP